MKIVRILQNHILIEQSLNEYKNKMFLFDISIDFGYFFYFGANTLIEAKDCELKIVILLIYKIWISLQYIILPIIKCGLII